MKSSILLMAFAAAILSSCSSAYKSGQTPDDLYFSSLPEQGKGGKEDQEYVETKKRDDRRYKGSDEYYEDRYLRMRVQDPNRWSVLDDYYFNNPYAYNYYGGYNSWYSPYNSYWLWNTYYNPYYSYYNPYCYGGYYGGGGIIIKNPAPYHVPSRPVAFNLNSYSNNNYNTAGRSSLNTYNSNTRYNNRNSNSGSLSNSVRKVFSNSGNNYNYNQGNNNNSTPSRSYTPSSSSGGGGGSRSSSSGSPSRPGR